MHHNRMDDKSGVQCIEVHKKREQGGARSVCPPGLSSVELIALPSSPSHTLCSLEMSVFPENWTASLSILHFSSRLAKTPKKEFYPNFPFDTLMNVKKVDTSWLGASRRLTFELGQSQSSAYILFQLVKSISSQDPLALVCKSLQNGAEMSVFPFTFPMQKTSYSCVWIHWISTNGRRP